MGGKGKGGDMPAPPPVQQQQTDMSQFLTPMMEMMGGMMGAMAPPETPPMPEISQPQPVDWKEKQAQLAAKVKADYALDSAKKKTRDSTVHTSPLLDEQSDKNLEDTVLTTNG